MRKSMAELFVFAVLVVSMMLGGLMLAPREAGAQGNVFPQDTNILPACAALEGALGGGGVISIAVKDLRSASEPNPPDVAAALDLLQREDEVGLGPHEAEPFAAAQETLTRYYGPICDTVGAGGGFGSALPEICAAYGVAINTGGELAVVAIKDLRSFVEPAPATLASALDTMQDAESDIPPSGSRPSSDVLDSAVGFLVGYFDLRCAGLDACPFARTAASPGDPGSASAARLLRGLTAPAPPGIDAALALISGAVTASPFHNSVAEAQAQIASYFPCEAVPIGLPNADLFELCADYSVLGIPEGPRVVAAVARLRERGVPASVGAALDVIVAFADETTPEPLLSALDSAYVDLDAFFGPLCFNLNQCPLVQLVLSSNPAVAQPAASLLGRLETPAPPGIGAALSFIAGEFDSPFHNNVGEAQGQILSYYPCLRPVFTG